MSSRAAATLATSVYSQLRDDLLNGQYPAGDKLRIERVAAKYRCGLSPVREALNRLSAERLIDRIDQRGFWVKPLSDGELQELTRTRCWLEERALRSRSQTGRGDGKSKSFWLYIALLGQQDVSRNSLLPEIRNGRTSIGRFTAH